MKSLIIYVAVSFVIGITSGFFAGRYTQTVEHDINIAKLKAEAAFEIEKKKDSLDVARADLSRLHAIADSLRARREALRLR